MENSAGRAHRRAGVATDAEVGIDDDLLAVFLAADGLCRADVDAGAAANFFVSAVGAEFLPGIEEFRFFKLAHQRAQAHERPGVLTIPAEITLRRRMPGERWRGAQAKPQVEFFAQRFRFPAEVDRTGHTANLDAAPM